MIMSIEEHIAKSLIDNDLSLACAESCSGGLLSHRLTNIPGSSSFLKASIVAYSNEAKEKILKVSTDLLKKNGAVSDPTAIAMAKGARIIFKADFGVAITGIAGPDGGTKAKPVGLVFIAINTPFESICHKCQFEGSRLEIKKQATTHALEMLENFL